MSEYSANSDSETTSENWNGVDQMSPLGGENTGYQFQVPFYQTQEITDINGVPQPIGLGPSDQAARPPRRTRTAYSLHQKSALEEFFVRKKYVSSYERSRLAVELSLSQKQVKIWFQNRRMKLKHEDAKSLGQIQAEGPRPRAVDVENTEIVRRLLKHSAVADLNTNAVPVMKVENVEAFTYPAFNEIAPQIEASAEGFANHQHFVPEHHQGRNFQDLQQNASMGLMQEGYMQEGYVQEKLIQEGHGVGGFYNQYNNNRQQHLQQFYFHDPNLYAPQQARQMGLTQGGPRDMSFHQNNNASFIPAASFQQVLPQVQGQGGYSDVVSSTRGADIHTRF